MYFVADQRFETVMGGLNPSLKFDLTDPENIGTFLKTRWDTDVETTLSNIGILRLTVKCRHWVQNGILIQSTDRIYP
jgi:hypothetical protein